MQLRIQHGLPGQLIFYKREDIAGPKLSNFSIANTEVKSTSFSASFFAMVILVVKYHTKKLPYLFLQNPEELKSILTSVLGVLGKQ